MTATSSDAPPIRRVGFVGLGSHGAPMALRILQAGFELVVWDSRAEAVRQLEEAGARVAQSLTELGQLSDLIGVGEVADPEWDEDEIETLVTGDGGLLSGARPDTIIAFHSAIYPSTVRRIAERAQAQGVHVVDAQVNGGEGRASDGTLTYMLGGDEQILERCQPIFAATGRTTVYLGELGAGAAAKVAHYILVCANLVAVSEVMRLVQSAGVDLEGFQKVVNESAGQSWACDHWLSDFTPVPEDRAEHLGRRVGYALGLAGELKLPLPSAGVVQQLMRSL